MGFYVDVAIKELTKVTFEAYRNGELGNPQGLNMNQISGIIKEYEDMAISVLCRENISFEIVRPVYFLLTVDFIIQLLEPSSRVTKKLLKLSRRVKLKYGLMINLDFAKDYTKGEINPICLPWINQNIVIYTRIYLLCQIRTLVQTNGRNDPQIPPLVEKCKEISKFLR